MVLVAECDEPGSFGFTPSFGFTGFGFNWSFGFNNFGFIRGFGFSFEFQLQAPRPLGLGPGRPPFGIIRQLARPGHYMPRRRTGIDGIDEGTPARRRATPAACGGKVRTCGTGGAIGLLGAGARAGCWAANGGFGVDFIDFISIFL